MVAQKNACRPPPPPPPNHPGVKRLKFLEKKNMLHIKLKGISMQQHGSKYFAHSPPPPPPRKVKIHDFRNMVILHIKGNRKCSNMVLNADRGTIIKKYIKPDF